MMTKMRKSMEEKRTDMRSGMRCSMRCGMRRLAGIAAAAILAAAAFSLAGCAGAASKLSDKFDEETVKSEAMKSIEYFNERDYESIREMGSEELKDAITAESFAEQCDPLLDKCGAFKEIKKTVVVGNTDKKTGAEYAGVVMVGVYEDGKIQFTIGFDEEMKLVQFLIK